MFDLRSFLDTVRQQRPHEIVDVRRQVSPRFETTAILAKFEASYRLPILFFHDVADSEFPLVTNVCGSLSRLALALGTTTRDLSQRYGQGCQTRIKPQLVGGNAPVHEKIMEDEAVDLGIFPKMIYHADDSPNPYITAAIVVAVDPETGRGNLSFHRLMITSRNHTGIYMATGKHLEAIYRKYEANNEPMPIAAIIGAHPIWSLGAVFTGPAEVEEYDIIGGLQGEALRVTECRRNPGLHVPADAEFVLEGIVRPHERIEEGPFGEFTGFATGTMKTPVFEVRAITSRAEPIFQDIVSGQTEHLILPLLGMEHSILEVARAASPTVKRAKVVAPMTVVVSIEKSDDTEPRRIIEALCHSDVYTKHVTVVDAEVDVANMRQVVSAVALHVQPDRDVYILSDQQGTPLDPSCSSETGITAKMGIDATAPLQRARPAVRNTVPQHVLDAIDISEFLGE